LDPHPVISVTGTPLKGMKSGIIRGEVVKWKGPISFLGDVDPERGTLEKDGRRTDVSGKVLVFPEGAGSTVGSYVIYNLKLNGKAPLALVMSRADAIITIGCILADIPLVHGIEDELMNEIHTGDIIEMDPSSGRIRVFGKHEAEGK